MAVPQSQATGAVGGGGGVYSGSSGAVAVVAVVVQVVVERLLALRQAHFQCDLLTAIQAWRCHLYTIPAYQKPPAGGNTVS